jgi:hypothetical protein
MAHGYLGDGYGVHGEFDPDREGAQDRERLERGWGERNEDRHGRFRDTGTMFGAWDKGRSGEERWSDRASRGYGPEFGSAQFEGEYEEGRSFSANPDDHYRSWRDRHISELDRDYEDYCREREQQFHTDFDAWRRQRHGSVQPLRTGMTQTGLSADPTGLTQAEAETIPASPEVEDPIANATLGTTQRGRGKI